MVIEKLQSLSKEIINSHVNALDSNTQTQIFMRCMQLLLLAEFEDQIHLFCNPDLEVISGHTLIMFSFPGATSASRQIIESRFIRSLFSCIDCVRSFNLCLSQIRSRFIIVRKIGVEQVLQFLDIVNDWLYSNLIDQFARLDRGELSPAQRKNLLYLCLSNATQLRKNPNLRAKVSSFLKDKIPSDFGNENKFLCSTAFFLVLGDDVEYEFAMKVIQTFQKNQLVLDPHVLDEVYFQFYRLQDSKFFTPDLSCRFWSMISMLLNTCERRESAKLLKPAELEEMSLYTNIRLFPLIKVLFNNLMANLDTPLSILLKVFRDLLLSYGSEFWKIADECHFSFIIETVPSNPSYMNQLNTAMVSSASDSNLLAWVRPFIDSLSGSQKQIAAIKLANAFFQVDGPSELIVRNLAVTLLLSCVDVEGKDTYNDSVSLLKLRDVRIVVEKNAFLLVRLARVQKCFEAQTLIQCCLKYDIAISALNCISIDKREIPSLSESNTKLWEELKQVPISDTDFAVKITSSFGDTLKAFTITEKKDAKMTQELAAALKIHIRDTKILSNNISSILDKLALLDPEQLKFVLSIHECAKGAWSCIFNAETSSSALSVVSQIEDTEGRYEAICFLLNFQLETNLRSYSSCLTQITELKLYEPCPKVLRISMDLIKALTDPLSGILNTQGSNHADSKTEIRRFWESSWTFLQMIYKETLTWANLYHLSDLIEFTRDTLDASHLLLDSFRVLLDYFSDQSLIAPLFESFMTTFTHVIVWLRLGDLSLLRSCVELVFKGFDLAKELKISVDKEFIITFAKYGAKAKKFNNKLSQQQRDMIIAKASEFDKALVAYVVEEAAKEQKVSRLSSPSPATLTSSTSPVTKLEISGAKTLSFESAKFNYQFSKPKELKQINLSRFGIVTKTPPVAPPPAQPFKATNLEAIRNELKTNRSAVKTQSTNPAPPRPAGFNNKAPVVGRSLNSLKPKPVDSDSSDEEDDVDMSDLFYDSKKKTKIIELDMSGKPIQKIAAPKKIDKEQKEEERMRLRLNVNLKPLYSTILKWNYNSNSEYPTLNRESYKMKGNIFSSAADYTKELEPLLMLECWQGIQASRTTGQEVAFELLVGSRTTCDGFFDVYASIKKSTLQQQKLGDSDLIVMGYVGDQNFESPGQIANYLKLPNTQTCLGKVREIKFANPDYCDITIRVFPQGLMMGLMTPKSVVVGMKVIQMVTLEREYSSLKGLQYYDLCENILTATPAPPISISKTVSEEMCKKLGVNASQANAIVGSSQGEGFSLIQGPPGTGKTKTILGIVGHFLSRAQKSSVITVPTPGLSPLPDAKPVAKILICAPSNAAVDELVLRLKDGVFTDSGENYTPKLIRLGRSDAMNTSVRDVSLEELVDRHLRERNDQVAINPNLRQEHNKCLADRDRIREALKGDLNDADVLRLELELREVNQKRSALGRKLDEQRETASVAARSRDIEKRRIQAKLINEAEVICSTLSGSAHDFLASMYIKFDQVIIDEACQCVELSAIIPLRYGCKKCVMVGDPNQLPPTVLSQRAAALKYEESLFVRMQRNHPDLVYLLDVQYRMHPEISQFPSLEFYNSRLTDGCGMLEKNRRPWHSIPLLSPYRFFDIVSKHQQNQRSKSFLNQTESMIALELVEKLMELLPGGQFLGKVGIISPYKEQIRNLRDVFQRKYGPVILREIDFNTVDGFQGQEKEIIIMSCVRASDTGSVGFLSDIRRMNVALTRARTTLWVLGNKASLSRDKVWNKLIRDAEARHCVSSVSRGFTLDMTLKQSQLQSLLEKCEYSGDPARTCGEISGQNNSCESQITDGTNRIPAANEGGMSIANECTTTSSRSGVYYRDATAGSIKNPLDKRSSSSTANSHYTANKGLSHFSQTTKENSGSSNSANQSNGELHHSRLFDNLQGASAQSDSKKSKKRNSNCVPEKRPRKKVFVYSLTAAPSPALQTSQRMSEVGSLVEESSGMSGNSVSTVETSAKRPNPPPKNSSSSIFIQKRRTSHKR